MPEGPSEARTGLTTRQGYLLTAQTGVEIARRVVLGGAAPGFQTPSLVFGGFHSAVRGRKARGTQPLSRRFDEKGEQRER